MDISSLRDRASAGALTVSELNNRIKSLIDGDRVLNAVSVTGEISNFTDHRSGHLYFTLKDSDAQIKAVMFRSARLKLKFMPEEGMKVTVHGSVSLYPQGGSVQLYANAMAPDGVGALYKAYEQLKEKLSLEGLFNEEFKKPIPRFPSRIGVITSPTGAAVRDIINVTGRRYPLAEIFLYPALVQGEGSEASLLSALDYLDKSKLVDVIIIGRGGGSIEDLWSFNSEKLARRIFEASTPIISAVGHETDFTICDFVADMRAPTPSAAAEISVPDIRDITLAIDGMTERAESALLRLTERKREKFTRLSERDIFKKPEAIFTDKERDIADLYTQAENLIQSFVKDKMMKLGVLSGKADALSPLSVLQRGYSVVNGDKGVVSTVNKVATGDKVKVTLSDGSFSANVISIEKE